MARPTGTGLRSRAPRSGGVGDLAQADGCRVQPSYVNAIAELCERLDADVADATEGIGYDKPIGQAFLSPGPGWGGSCLPKDTQALLQAADSADFEFRLVRAAIETNTRQYQRMVGKVRLAVTGKRTGSLSRRRIALFGLTFKANPAHHVGKHHATW